MEIKPTKAQRELYVLLSKFTADMLTSLVLSLQRNYGFKVMGRLDLTVAITQLTEKYLNTCVANVYTREDKYIAGALDIIQRVRLVPDAPTWDDSVAAAICIATGIDITSSSAAQHAPAGVESEQWAQHDTLHPVDAIELCGMLAIECINAVKFAEHIHSDEKTTLMNVRGAVSLALYHRRDIAATIVPSKPGAHSEPPSRPLFSFSVVPVSQLTEALREASGAPQQRKAADA